MDQDGNPSQLEDSNFNLYDTYGSTMEGVVTTHNSGFPLDDGGDGGWDHDPDEVVVVDYHDNNDQNAGYNSSTTSMNTFENTAYGHEFQHNEGFDQHGHEFQDY